MTTPQNAKSLKMRNRKCTICWMAVGMIYRHELQAKGGKVKQQADFRAQKAAEPKMSARHCTASN